MEIANFELLISNSFSFADGGFCLDSFECLGSYGH